MQTEQIEAILKYHFNNPEILKRALTHSSLTKDIHQNYERLEFLGDRILGVTIADMLCRTFPDEPEGQLSQRFVKLVCKQTVAEIVLNLGLAPHIEAYMLETQTATNVLCDVGEAVIAAIYMDSGDIKIAQDFVRKNWGGHIDKTSVVHKDYKTFLQEQVYKLHLPQPVYVLLEKSGQDHEPEFVMQVKVGGHITEGRGHNKKEAAQAAAQNMLAELGVKDYE